MSKENNIIDLLSHKHLATIVELQKFAMSMTMEDFIEFIKAEYNVRECDDYIDFDYHDLTATINKSNHTLSGSFDIWDEEGTWCDTFFCQCVSFKGKNERALSVRAFSEKDKRTKYEQQNHICPICGKEHPFENMDGDHILEWSKGGRTILENLQMVCKGCHKELTKRM